MSQANKGVDVGLLKDAYQQVNRQAGNSVRSAWRFGQAIDSQTDYSTIRDISYVMGLSYATIHKYHKFYGCFQRPELAMELAEQIDSWDVQLLILTVEGGEAPERRPLAGRRFRYRCNHCHSDDIMREEFDPATDDLVTA